MYKYLAQRILNLVTVLRVGWEDLRVVTGLRKVVFLIRAAGGMRERADVKCSVASEESEEEIKEGRLSVFMTLGFSEEDGPTLDHHISFPGLSLPVIKRRTTPLSNHSETSRREVREKGKEGPDLAPHFPFPNSRFSWV